MTWQASSYLILVLVLGLGCGWYERRRPSARVVALVAALAALAVVGRLAFAALPNVKPTTDVVLFAGYALGGAPGFMVGAVTALASNAFLGQGGWTPWQMVAWAGVGVAGAGLARLLRGREPSRLGLAVVCGLAGLAFGAFMDAYQWTLAAHQDLDSYLVISASSLPYNLAHAIGNVVFCLVLGPAFIRALRRYRRRFEVHWETSRPADGLRVPAGLAAALLCVALGGLALAPPRAQAASPASKAARYLLRAQNGDGGYGAQRGDSSNRLFTGWGALGLASAGINPGDVARGGRSITAYLAEGTPGDVGAIERTILVLRASGISARRFGGRNLSATLLARRRANGSWGGNVGHTAFGVLALRSLGRSPESETMLWLAHAQNGDGGFGYLPSATSDVDDTGAALEALAAGGRRSGTAVRNALAFLRARQNRDGGFGQNAGSSSNAQSTAWAVQGLVAVGKRPSSLPRDPLRYLRGLQRSDGHISYSRSSDQTPVWVTGQALAALRGRAFPIATVPRRSRARKSTSTETTTTPPPPTAASRSATPKATAGGPKPKRGSKSTTKRGADAKPRRGHKSLVPSASGGTSAPPAPDVPKLTAVPGFARSRASRERVDNPPAWLLGLAASTALGLVGLLRRRLPGRPLRRRRAPTGA